MVWTVDGGSDRAVNRIDSNRFLFCRIAHHYSTDARWLQIMIHTDLYTLPALDIFICSKLKLQRISERNIGHWRQRNRALAATPNSAKKE